VHKVPVYGFECLISEQESIVFSVFFLQVVALRAWAVSAVFLTVWKKKRFFYSVQPNGFSGFWVFCWIWGFLWGSA